MAGLLILTFLTAFKVAYINLLSNKKLTRHFFLIAFAWPVWLFCIIYGCIGVILFLLLNDKALEIATNNTRISHSYITAFLIGLMTKGIADIKFFDIKHHGETFPIGLRSITQAMDVEFDKTFDSVVFRRFLRFIAPFQEKHRNTDLCSFKKGIIDVLAAHPSNEKVALFISEVVQPAISSKEILAGILREFGKNTLIEIDRQISVDR